MDGGLDSAVAHGQIVLDSFEPDVAKAGAAQDLLHSIGIAHREGTGSARRRRRGHRQHGGVRHVDGDRDAAAGPQGEG